MKILFVTVGLPQSGKSTWAKNTGFPVVNRDSIRLALHGEVYIQEAEDMITAMETYMVKSLFNAGHGIVVVDSTHMRKEYRDRWISSKWETRFMEFNTSKKICI